jgi:hypothetical protein
MEETSEVVRNPCRSQHLGLNLAVANHIEDIGVLIVRRLFSRSGFLKTPGVTTARPKM